ncbi:MAG TPA: hypothetical protein VLX92_24650 [Kofleriaceae bacterium]|nr:hypothetical protein [Kofleriaceae bacterium]
MREHVAAVALAIALPAHADPPSPLDASALAGHLHVYHDDLGHYIVVPDVVHDVKDPHSWVFYGDAGTLYEQRLIVFSVRDGTLDWSVWAPRAKGMHWANLELRRGALSLQCRPHDKTALVELAAADARAFLAHARLMPPLWQREIHLVARDDDGVYYLVDRLRSDLGGHGDRVFVGLPGAMKELALTNLADDSAGELYVTRAGSLKVATARSGTTASWIKGGKSLPLTALDPTAAGTHYTVYRELGLYGSLGAVCDDL